MLIYFFVDVTIYDHANAAVCKSRAKKSVTSVTQVVKQLETTVEASWDDEDEEDFDLVQEEDDDGTTKVTIKRRSKKQKQVTTNTFYQYSGYQYPLDIWFLISEYITPEDVGRFAGICRSTYAVVCTAKFWFTLYRRYYTPCPTLPERLQPECMVRLYGLRTSVIRALHHMYPPFIVYMKSLERKSPRVLLKQQCILMWHKKRTSKCWMIYFKFKEPDIISHQRKITQKPDLVDMLEDIYANNDDKCRILQIACKNYNPTSSVVGLYLADASVKLSQNLTQHRIELTFASSLVCSNAGKDPLGTHNTTVIVMDPVLKLGVLDWWYPDYIHSPFTASLVANDDLT